MLQLVHECSLQVASMKPAIKRAENIESYDLNQITNNANTNQTNMAINNSHSKARKIVLTTFQKQKYKSQ